MVAPRSMNAGPADAAHRTRLRAAVLPPSSTGWLRAVCHLTMANELGDTTANGNADPPADTVAGHCATQNARHGWR